MGEDLELDLQDENINKTEERIKNLSTKAREAYSERDEAAKKAQDAETARLAAEQERDFFKDFSGIASKYQSAPEYQDQILEKVRSGYSVEDATVSVLNAEGKLLPQEPAAPAPQAPAAGGSAATTLTQPSKAVSEMSVEEKRNALMELLG
jgi:hypothetical protein